LPYVPSLFIVQLIKSDNFLSSLATLILFYFDLLKIEKIEDGVPALYRVTGLMDDGTEVVGEYNTVS